MPQSMAEGAAVVVDDRLRAAKRKRAQEKAYAEYKLLNQEIDSFDRVGRTEEANEFISKHLAKTAKLYPKIHKRYDLAPIDAEHFKRLAALGEEATKKFKIGSALFDLIVFGKKLKRAISSVEATDNGFYARCVLAKGINDCIPSAPAFEFAYGAINPEGIEPRARIVRRIDRKLKTEPKVFVKATEKDTAAETNQDATPKEVDHIYKRLRVKAKRNNVEQIAILDNVLDPQSFGQSVENLFHFSFLVKDGKVAIQESNDGKPMCRFIKPTSSQNDTKDKNQSILSFSMADYRRWIHESSGSENNENS